MKLVNNGWYYEPSVAEHVFDQLVSAEGKQLHWMPGLHLLSATVNVRRLVPVELETPEGAALQVSAKTFIDATYEGDLAATAKVPYRVGRESKAEYGEPFAGIHYMNWRTGKQVITPDTWEASPAIQAFLREIDFHRRSGPPYRHREACFLRSAPGGLRAFAAGFLEWADYQLELGTPVAAAEVSDERRGSIANFEDQSLVL